MQLSCSSSVTKKYWNYSAFASSCLLLVLFQTSSVSCTTYNFLFFPRSLQITTPSALFVSNCQKVNVNIQLNSLAHSECLGLRILRIDVCFHQRDTVTRHHALVCLFCSVCLCHFILRYILVGVNFDGKNGGQGHLLTITGTTMGQKNIENFTLHTRLLRYYFRVQNTADYCDFDWISALPLHTHTYRLNGSIGRAHAHSLNWLLWEIACLRSVVFYDSHKRHHGLLWIWILALAWGRTHACMCVCV